MSEQDRRRRLRLIATGAGFAALVVLLILSGVTALRHVSTGSGPATTVTLAPPQITVAAPSTTQASAATASTTPTSTTPTTQAAPSTTTIPAADLVNRPVGAAGAILVAPASPDRRSEDAPNDCYSLADAGFQNVDCRSTGTTAGSLTYLIEFAPASATAISARAYVFRQNPDGSEQVVLEALDDNGTHFVAGEIDAHVTTIAAAGGQELTFGFHEQGPNFGLAIDIVEAPGVVVAHQELSQGVATVSPGQLDTWSGPPNGSTTGDWTHDVIKKVPAGWRVVEEERNVPAESVPLTAFA